MNVELMSLRDFILEWVLIYALKTHFLMFHVTFQIFTLMLFDFLTFSFDSLMMLWQSSF